MKYPRKDVHIFYFDGKVQSRRGVADFERQQKGTYLIQFPKDRPVRPTSHLFTVQMFNEDEPRTSQLFGEGGDEICLFVFNKDGELSDGDFQLVAERI